MNLWLGRIVCAWKGKHPRRQRVLVDTMEKLRCSRCGDLTPVPQRKPKAAP